MGMPVRIDNLLYEQAKNEAKLEHRTIAGQILVPSPVPEQSCET